MNKLAISIFLITLSGLGAVYGMHNETMLEQSNLDQALLNACARNESIDQIQHLLEQKASVNVQSTELHNYTPLHYTAGWFGDVNVMQLLINNEAEVNQPDGNGNTPLLTATICDNVKATLLLIARNANIHTQDKDGRTPLHRAAEHVNTEAAELLLDHKSDINQPNRFNNTPLDVAINHNHTNTIPILLEHGAIVDNKSINKVRNPHTQSILEQAQKAQQKLQRLLPLFRLFTEGSTCNHKRRSFLS